MKYPIGSQTFSTLIEEGMVYVDKTDLVYDIAQRHICFFARPRRFGKSLTLSTLKSYFKGEKELFRGLKMEQLEHDWKVYPVLHIDFATGNFKQEDYIEALMRNNLELWETEFGVRTHVGKMGVRFANVIQQAHEATGEKVVVLVDEYDKPLLDVLGLEVEQKNRDTLRELYGTFKAADEHLRFVMLTGVTKFSQVSVFSGFNQPEDISMSSRFDALCGITEAELHAYFDEEMAAMAQKRGVTKEEMYRLFKRHYDGYHFSEEMVDVYNPFSVINALSQQRLDDYWFASGTPTYLIRLLNRDKVNVQEMLGRTYQKNYFMNYRADGEDPLAMIYQSGYLTIKGYDSQFDEFKLDFPNKEVRNGFLYLVFNDYFKVKDNATNIVVNIAKMLRDCRLEELRDTLMSFFASVPYSANMQERAWSFESHYHYTLYLIFRLLSCYTTLIEKQNARGRADLIVENDNYVYIFEFKLDGTAEEALEQIAAQGYAEPYATDPRKVVRIGVSFSSAQHNIAEWQVVK